MVMKVVAAVLRLARIGVWCLLLGVVSVLLIDFEQTWVVLTGAPQQAALAGQKCAHLIGAYAFARALDRILAVAHETVSGWFSQESTAKPDGSGS
jgi:hypothetical protein